MADVQQDERLAGRHRHDRLLNRQAPVDSTLAEQLTDALVALLGSGPDGAV
jgi:hypothetical protein